MCLMFVLSPFLCSKKSGLRRKCGSSRSPHRAPVHYQLHPSRRMPSGNSRLVSQQDSKLATVPVLLLQLLLNEINELKQIIPHHPFIWRSFSLTGISLDSYTNFLLVWETYLSRGLNLHETNGLAAKLFVYPCLCPQAVKKFLPRCRNSFAPHAKHD